MNNRIQSYSDLLEEKKRLEGLLQSQRGVLHNDINELKESLRPVISTVSEVSKLFTRSNENMVVTGVSNLLIDLVFKKIILSRASWLTRQAVPFLLKNYSSHFMSEHKNQFLQKLFSLFSSKNGKEEASAHAPE